MTFSQVRGKLEEVSKLGTGAIEIKSGYDCCWLAN
jgi:hypothetical protein